MDFEMYVIQNRNTDEFLAFDWDFGMEGCYWTKYFTSAKFFDKFEDAFNTLHSKDFDSNNVHTMSDGTIYPTRAISTALHLNNENTSGSANIWIVKISLGGHCFRTIKGEIKRPTGYTYE